MSQLPPGWATHPQNPQYLYEVANPQNVQPLTAFASSPAAMGYAQPPAVDPIMQQQGYGDGSNPAVAYQDIDVTSWLDEHEAQTKSVMGFFDKEDNFIWVDFDKLTSVGSKSILVVRLLPNLKQPQDLCLPHSRHRMFVEYIPGDHGNAQIRYVPCFNQPGGPQNCPICSSIEQITTSGIQGAAEHVANFKAHTTMVWQCIWLDDPTKHYVQEKNDSNQLKVDAAGNPVWKMVPGVMRMKQSMHRSILEFMRAKGNPAHPETGYPMQCTKHKHGSRQTDVKYSAMDLAPAPIDAQLYPILANSLDLREEVLVKGFYKVEDMAAIGANMLAKFGLGAPAAALPAGGAAPGAMPAVGGMPDQGQWLPHNTPGWEYNTLTHQVRPAGAAPPAPPQAFASPPVAPVGHYPPAAPPAPVYQQPPAPVYQQPVAAQAMPPMPAMPPGPPPAAPGGPPLPPPAGTPMAPPVAAALPPGPAPAPPRGLPPIGAPGLPPTQQQALALPPMPPPPPGPGMPPGAMGMPMGTPPAPGMPPGALAPPPPPPAPDGHGAAGGMTPEQLEASLGVLGDAPF